MNKINSNFEGETIFVGMDIHKSSWNLGIHLNDMFVKNVHQKPNPPHHGQLFKTTLSWR